VSAGLPQALAGLLSPLAYPHPVDRVEIIETHISWVLLAGDFAYKIKRPVCYPFIDLRSPERRRFLCEEELRLNCRFAPELYLEVLPIVRVEGEARVGGEGPVLEHAVRMRRFDRTEELDRLLDTRRVGPAELEAFGRSLAAIHARLPVAPEAAPWGRPTEVHSLMLRNFEECAQASTAFGRTEEVLALRGALEGRLAAAASWLAARRAAGHIRECHGDLHSRNVVRMGSRLIAFDCLEFDPALRWIDVADEIALLSSDLIARDRPVCAHAFRGGYLAEGGDYQACRVLKLYQAHRALVRAKVAALSASGKGDETERDTLCEEHEALLNCARTSLEAQRDRPVLLLMCGLSASGKTWLARLLAPRLDAVHLRSDVERKRRTGLGALTPSHSGLATGLYTPEARDAAYEDLARAAEDALAGGYTAIVDAAFLERAQRRRFAALAHRLGVPLHLVCCEAPPPLLKARITARRRGGRDPSEADESVLQWQMAHREAVIADEGIDTIGVESADADALERILARVRDRSAA
jgi:uncharacterized protein